MRASERQTVLIVDDSILICQQIKKHHERGRHQSGGSPLSKEALAAMELCRPDLVLLDVVLPDAEGYDLCRQLQERDENNASIIFITSKDSDKDVMRGFSLAPAIILKSPSGRKN